MVSIKTPGASQIPGILLLNPLSFCDEYEKLSFGISFIPAIFCFGSKLISFLPHGHKRLIMYCHSAGWAGLTFLKTLEIDPHPGLNVTKAG